MELIKQYHLSFVKSGKWRRALWMIGIAVCVYLFPSVSSATITISSIATTVSTCGNNGTATISAFSNKANPYLIYEIVAGPVTAPLQNNSTFSSLFPGTYTVRVYDIDFQSKDAQFAIGGNYQLPDLLPKSINPLCIGSSDGLIIGHAVAGTGKAPYTWELISPYATAPQLSDTLKNLSSGSYTIKVTDDCGNYQTRTVILQAGSTGLAYWYDGIPTVVKIGCDTVILSQQVYLYKEKAHIPLKQVVYTSSGTITKYVYAQPLDTSNYNPGFYQTIDTLVGIDYGNYLYAILQDTCGVTLYARAATVAPFKFDIYYNTSVSCGNKMAATLRLWDSPEHSGYIHTGFKPPVKMTLTDVAANQLVDSSTCLYSYCAIDIKEQVSGRYYDLRIVDGCGEVYQQRILWPIPAAPRVEVTPGVGCMDSTSAVGFTFYNFKSYVNLEILSGPSVVKSTKPHYTFSDVITYPKVFSSTRGGLGIKNMAKGTYTYRVSDTCGNVINGTFTVQDIHLANFNYTYAIKKGCLGNNTLKFDGSSPNTVAVYLNNNTTGTLLYNRRGGVTADSLSSLAPGDYVLSIYYGYDAISQSGAYYDGSMTIGTPDCWAVKDTITIPPYSNNAFQSNTSIFCNGDIYVQLNMDSTRGVPPYQFEITSGPQTFPLQNSNVFKLPAFGNYTIRVHDGCGNSNIRQISVDSAKFAPLIQKGSSCIGNRLVLKGVSSPFFVYEWKRPNGTVYVGDSLVFDPLKLSDVGDYLITKKVTINGCTSAFQTTHHVYANDFITQTVPFCGATAWHVGSNVYTSPGIFTDTLTNASGCDSVVVTTLKVLPQKIDTTHISICEGASFTVGTNVYTHTGIYKDSLVNASGCYDLLITDLKVNGLFNPAPTVRTLCPGSSIAVGSHLYGVSGMYRDTLVTAGGCDSVIITDLTVLPYKTNTLTRVICEGQSVSVGMHRYTQTGIYKDTLFTIHCDSIVTLNLTVQPFKRNTVVRSICQGQSITVGSHVYSQTGQYKDTLSTTGCDSIVTLQLAVQPYKRNTLMKSICAGQQVTVGIHSYNQNGTFQDTLSTAGCDSIITLQLTVHALPSLNLGKDTSLCQGQQLVLNAGNGFTDYYWNDGPSTPQQHTQTVSAKGKYWLDIKDQFGCVAADTIEILNVYALPAASIQPVDTVCSAVSTTLTASGGVRYLWSPGGETQPVITVSPVATTQYGVTVYDAHNCSASATVKLNVYPVPLRPVLSANEIKHCFGTNELTLTAAWGESFLWMPGGEVTQSIQVTAGGTYVVTVSDQYHCQSSGRVIVKEYCETTLFLPNAFSPNGDGLHDDLEIFGRYFTNFKITIFNRWGEIIFISTDRNIRWDGMYRGEEMPIGTYPWMVTYESIFDPGKAYQAKGSITVVR
jgi:gliding motility-associated-like protein